MTMTHLTHDHRTSLRLSAWTGIVLLASACGGTDAVGPAPYAVSFHELQTEPGCFVPQAPPVTTREMGTRSFEEMLAAVRQMREFEIALSLQNAKLMTKIMLDEPTAASWSLSSGTNTSRSALSSVGAPGYRSEGSIPANTAPAASFGAEIDIELREQAVDTGAVDIRQARTQCVEEDGENIEHCDVEITKGEGRYSPVVSEIEQGTRRVLWSDHFVRIDSEGGSTPMYHRGCDPQTGISFELDVVFVSFEDGFATRMRCWQSDGVAVDCEGVDLTP